MELHTIGIDLGETVFHLVGAVMRKKFSRKQLLHFTANLQVELIGMEACGGAVARQNSGHRHFRSCTVRCVVSKRPRLLMMRVVRSFGTSRAPYLSARGDEPKVNCTQRSERIAALGKELNLLLWWDSAYGSENPTSPPDADGRRAREIRRSEIVREFLSIHDACQKDEAPLPTWRNVKCDRCLDGRFVRRLDAH